MTTYKSLASIFLSFALILAVLPIGVNGSHSWGSYHWLKSSSAVPLILVDSNTPDWDSAFGRAESDWDRSTVLDLSSETGPSSSRDRKQCRAISGKIRSCNAPYGFNGWLGLATISISGGHITQATSKMNDSYFNSGNYNATNRSHVMCQEIGHGFGLAHQSESGADLNTCMDYANALDNPSPNQHDYDQLLSIYSHSHNALSLASSADDFSEFGDDPDAPHNWGRLVSQSEDGRSSVYEREHFNGNKTVRHVFWTREAADRCHACDHRYDH